LFWGNFLLHVLHVFLKHIFILVLQDVGCKQTVSTWNNHIVWEVSTDLFFEVKRHKLQKHGLMSIQKNFWFLWAKMSWRFCWSFKSSGAWCCVVGPVSVNSSWNAWSWRLRNYDTSKFRERLADGHSATFQKTSDSTWLLCFVSMIHVRFSRQVFDSYTHRLL
jgi:hypothetical protein